jgi:L-serine dehydratase
MQCISVFDMLKIGVGPSSSHTLGPWRAAQRFLTELQVAAALNTVEQITIELFGSLAKTGKGHASDTAIMLGLSGEDPVTCDTTQIAAQVQHIGATHRLNLLQQHSIDFDPAADLIFHRDRALPFHPNGLRFTAWLTDQSAFSETYYSVGGGFVVIENDSNTAEQNVTLPYPCDRAQDVLNHCQTEGLSIWEMVWINERVWRSDADIRAGLLKIWETMADCVYRGCHTPGELPGGLQVVRRAPQMHDKLIGDMPYNNRDEWIAQIKDSHFTFQQVVKWISCFALAVNEENAALGRVVTAPTNGAAGVIPAVLMHYVCSHDVDDDAIIRFLLVAAEIGSLFKKGATISAAQGGCQAEIGVSSAMAAAALTECLGGSVEQALMAAEIAMEHHLGLTCDPIAGLVQIPCIERNAMGAMKAITAANIALESTPQHAKVSLDAVIRTMWETALDMNDKYKETSEGGLAIHIPVNLAEC